MAAKPVRNCKNKTRTLTAWLTFDAEGFNRMTKTQPHVGGGERRIQVQLTVPEALFQEPDLKASITLDGLPDISDQIAAESTLRQAVEAIPGIQLTIGDAK